MHNRDAPIWVMNGFLSDGWHPHSGWIIGLIREIGKDCDLVRMAGLDGYEIIIKYFCFRVNIVSGISGSIRVLQIYMDIYAWVVRYWLINPRLWRKENHIVKIRTKVFTLILHTNHCYNTAHKAYHFWTLGHQSLAKDKSCSCLDCWLLNLEQAFLSLINPLVNKS